MGQVSVPQRRKCLSAVILDVLLGALSILTRSCVSPIMREHPFETVAVDRGP